MTFVISFVVKYEKLIGKSSHYVEAWAIILLTLYVKDDNDYRDGSGSSGLGGSIWQ